MQNMLNCISAFCPFVDLYISLWICPTKICMHTRIEYNSDHKHIKGFENYVKQRASHKTKTTAKTVKFTIIFTPRYHVHENKKKLKKKKHIKTYLVQFDKPVQLQDSLDQLLPICHSSCTHSYVQFYRLVHHYPNGPTSLPRSHKEKACLINKKSFNLLRLIYYTFTDILCGSLIRQKRQA